jgi:hypothetical protein
LPVFPSILLNNLLGYIERLSSYGEEGIILLVQMISTY